MSYENDTEKYWPGQSRGEKWYSRKFFAFNWSIADWRERTWRILWQKAENSPARIQRKWQVAYERFQSRKKPNYHGMYGGHWRKTIYRR